MRTRLVAWLMVLAAIGTTAAACDDRPARSPKQRARKQCFEDSECKQSRHCYKPAPDQWGYCDPGDAGAPPPGTYDPSQGPRTGDGGYEQAPPPTEPTVRPQPGDIQI